MLEAISGLTVDLGSPDLWLGGLQSAIPGFSLKSGLGIYDHYGGHGLIPDHFRSDSGQWLQTRFDLLFGAMVTQSGEIALPLL